MTKTTRNLALLAVFSIIVAGCTTLLNTQANSWADQAEQIARNCPAAAEKAAEARQAANQAAELSNRLNNINRIETALASATSRLDSIWQDAVRKGYATDTRDLDSFLSNKRKAYLDREYADALRRRPGGAGGDEAYIKEIEAGALEAEKGANQKLFGVSSDEHRRKSERCARNAEKWKDHGGQPGTPDGMEDCSTRTFDPNAANTGAWGSAHQCASASECSLQAVNSAQQGATAEADHELAALREQANRAAMDVIQLGSELAMEQLWLRDLMDDMEEDSGITGSNTWTGENPVQLVADTQAITEKLNKKAQRALLEAQQVAAEQCGEGAALQDAPPIPSLPSGAYPQDILNSQSMGLPALPGGPAPLACCSTNAACAICTGGCPAFCSVCNTGC